jgi:putative NADH-flavin reductase
MKLALLGATGFVGSALLKEALERGHTVTAIVRHPEKLEQKEMGWLQEPATSMTRVLMRS